MALIEEFQRKRRAEVLPLVDWALSVCSQRGWGYYSSGFAKLKKALENGDSNLRGIFGIYARKNAANVDVESNAYRFDRRYQVFNGLNKDALNTYSSMETNNADSSGQSSDSESLQRAVQSASDLLNGRQK